MKVGVEIELIAPRGRTRRDLAAALAEAAGGRVERFFHPQSEPAVVPGTPVFENLTLGFVAVGGNGEAFARCVDDLTLQDDCDRTAAPKAGWYRIVSDDARLLRLLALHCNAESPIERVLGPIAEVFGVEPEESGGMWRLTDRGGASICIAAPAPGERERPCELVTAPLEDRHEERIEALLGMARALGFFAPAEGAVHLHFDATRFASARFVKNLVELQLRDGPSWKARFRTNPRCRKLGPPPPGLIELVRQDGFVDRPWEQVRRQILDVKIEKWVDVNLVNLVRENPNKYTVEVRILPVWTETEPIMDAIRFFDEVLEGCR